MHILDKVLNVLGILLAWVLSIALVIMLLVTPIVLSALSLLEPETITGAVTDALTGLLPSADDLLPNDDAAGAKQEQWGVVHLSNTTDDSNAPSDEDMQLGMDILEGFLGEDAANISQEALETILSSNVAKEILESYTNDIANALTGNTDTPQFNAENIQKIITDNMDEVVNIIQDLSPDLKDMEVEEIKSNIQTIVDENIGEFMEALPSPEDVKSDLMEESPALQTLFDILAMRNSIKFAFIGAIAIICVIIFLFRLPGLRGFRWISTNLFISSILGGVLSTLLLTSTSAIMAMLGDTPGLNDLLGSLLSKFSTGMLIRYAIMLAFAIILLVVYILIKKARSKASAEA